MATDDKVVLDVELLHSISGRDTTFTTWWTPWSGVDLSSGRFEDVQATALPHAGRVRARVTVSGAGASAQIRLRAEVRTS